MGNSEIPFGLALSNIPVINLRREFEEHLRLLETGQFRSQLYDFSTPVDLPRLKWTGLPDDLLTMILQRAILGLESYVGAAVEYELTARQQLTEEKKKYLSNPFQLRGNGTADILFNRLPALVSESIQLAKVNPGLSERVREFYSAVRNPLFHGYQLSCATPDQVLAALVLIAAIYEWIDSWYTAFSPSAFVARLSGS